MSYGFSLIQYVSLKSYDKDYDKQTPSFFTFYSQRKELRCIYLNNEDVSICRCPHYKFCNKAPISNIKFLIVLATIYCISDEAGP